MAANPKPVKKAKKLGVRWGSERPADLGKATAGLVDTRKADLPGVDEERSESPGIVDLVDALNADLEGFNEKRRENLEVVWGDWVILEVTPRGREAIVVVTDDDARHEVTVPITYELVESGRQSPHARGPVADRQFSADLMGVLWRLDVERQPRDEPNPLHVESLELLRRREIGELARRMNAEPQAAWNFLLAPLIRGPDDAIDAPTRAACAGPLLLALDAPVLRAWLEEVCVFAINERDEALLRRIAPWLSTHHLRPYGPIRATLRGLRMRGSELADFGERLLGITS